MSKFSGTRRRPLRANLTAPVRTDGRRTLTHEGGDAYVRDAESELFLLAVTNMVGEDTFYERATDRDARFADLVHRVTAVNPAFVAGLAPADRRAVLRHRRTALADAGVSWERLSGWLPGGMDPEAWAHAIPSMGVMALVRNLRNFDEAGIGDDAIEAVIAKITDSGEVAKARLFPYQVWAAYRHTPLDDWKRALGLTLDHTVANIPALDGTLVPLIYTFNLAGYRPSALAAGGHGRCTLGGFTDATFTVVKVLEDGRNAGWPWMA